MAQFRFRVDAISAWITFRATNSFVTSKNFSSVSVRSSVIICVRTSWNSEGLRIFSASVSASSRQPRKTARRLQELELPIATPPPKRPTAARTAKPTPAPRRCREVCESESGRKHIEVSFKIVNKSCHDSWSSWSVWKSIQLTLKPEELDAKWMEKLRKQNSEGSSDIEERRWRSRSMSSFTKMSWVGNGTKKATRIDFSADKIKLCSLNRILCSSKFSWLLGSSKIEAQWLRTEAGVKIRSSRRRMFASCRC